MDLSPVLLLNTLDELTDDDLHRFQWYLTTKNAQDPFPHIPRCQLENVTQPDIVTKMVEKYGNTGALEITLIILEKLNYNQQAELLKTRLRDAGISLIGEDGMFAAQAALYCPTKSTGSLVTISDEVSVYQDVSIQLKHNLVIQFDRILEGNSLTGHRRYLNDVYTDLYVVKNETGGVIEEHEVRMVESSPRSYAAEDVQIKCNDLFKVHPGTNRRNRKVLTMGIAGVGKTFSVNKFILDWAEGRENQDIDFIFPLPFRELNMKKNEQFSLIDLLYEFVLDSNEIKSLPTGDGKVMFIFDGLDECRFNLDFDNTEKLKDISKKTSIGTIITNLIKRTLLPFALIWITSRPAAVHLIGRDYIDQVTEVRGFNDKQKEEYLSKCCDEKLATKIISHIKKSKSLYAMCQIPVFCWISVLVLQEQLTNDSIKSIPATLTGMFTNFVLQQSRNMDQRYLEASKKRFDSQKVILKLGKLALRKLEKGELMFYEEELKECGIDISCGAVYSGMCTEIFRQQHSFSEKKVFSFVHLSVQEFLAALYVLHSQCKQIKRNALKPKSFINILRWGNKTIVDLHRCAIDKALESKNGHLDLFLRFLMGLSVEVNQSELRGLLPKLRTSPESMRRTVRYVNEKLNSYRISFDASINLLHCLSEMKDDSLLSNIKTPTIASSRLSAAEWSALAFHLLTSEETMEKFEMKKYIQANEGFTRLLPVVKNTRHALLNSCNLSSSSCDDLASVLSKDSALRALDLSDNGLFDMGMENLSNGLKNSHCKVEILRLCYCNLSKKSCEVLGSVLKSKSSLTELDLSNNELQDSGVNLLFNGVKMSRCKLKALRLCYCNLTENIGGVLAVILQSESHMRALDLSNNDLQDSGVKLLSAGLKSKHCKLETLRLSGCMVTEDGCSALASALSSNPSHLKQLDLSYNHPGYSGMKMFSDKLEDPHYKLETLKIDNGDECRITLGLRKYACELTLDPNTAGQMLFLDEDKSLSVQRNLQPYPDHPERFEPFCQVLCRESLSGRCYWEAEWNGIPVIIAMAYKAICRKGKASDFGETRFSWGLVCRADGCFVIHNQTLKFIPTPPSTRVGVYLDSEAGTLSFYSICENTQKLLHTFHSTFTEPLYAGLQLVMFNSSARLLN